MIFRVIFVMVAVLIAVVVSLLGWMFFSERPPNMTDPQVLAGDGSTLNYCEQPPLDGNGLEAIQIPKANTPGCHYDHFPLPVLAECSEPLAAGATDIRGLWQGVDGREGHVERIEQCGSRTVITTSGIIHDYGPNATGSLNTNDTEGAILLTLGDRAYCNRTSASMIWNQGVLNFHAFGWGPVVVRRYLDGEQLVWEYADGTTTRMERICQLPAAHRVPKPRYIF